jgi:hypothetical protein
MVHRRTAIAAAAVSRLSAIPEFSGPGKCARGRAAAVPQELLPALTATWGEAGETASRRPSSGPNGEDGYDRILPFSIIVHLRATDPEDEFDRIALLVEAAMEEDVSLGGIAVDLELQSTRLFVDQATGIPMAVGSLLYQVRFKTLASNPGLPAL